MPGARFVVSESGDILSPKYAPETMAPAAMANGTPSPSATPIKATPTVPAVVQELPVTKDTTAHPAQAAARNHAGDNSLTPTAINIGTTPLAIQTPINAPTTNKIRIEPRAGCMPCPSPR